MITAQEAAEKSEASAEEAFKNGMVEAEDAVNTAVSMGRRSTNTSLMGETTADMVSEKLTYLGYVVTKKSSASGTCLCISW